MSNINSMLDEMCQSTFDSMVRLFEEAGNQEIANKLKDKGRLPLSIASHGESEVIELMGIKMIKSPIIGKDQIIM